MANPVGRPTKYNKQLQSEADRYVYDWSQTDAVPSRVGLCCWLGISKHTSYQWGREHPEFSATLEAVEALQEHVAMNKGITGEFNSTITKLVLANHGYSERNEIDHKSSDRSMTPRDLSDDELAQIASADKS